MTMENKWIVAKFGGSSVKDAKAMLLCSLIIENNPLIKIVVISATQNTTNELEQVARAAEINDVEALNNRLTQLITKHQNLAKDLFSSVAVLSELDILFLELRSYADNIFKEKLLTHKMMDQLYSIGERLSSLIISDLLRLRLPDKKIMFLDARKIIKTSSDFLRAEPQVDLIAKNAKNMIVPFLNENILFVTQGFIGEDLLGNTTTLGREGSDYSAALFGEAIEAAHVQIWTDVPGVASSDPKIVENAQFLKNLSYDEATALATLGAKILFPTTLLPTKRKNISVYVGSSSNPNLGGTFITKEQTSGFSLKAVSQLVTSDFVLLSFIGTKLDEKENLVLHLHQELGTHLFDFFNLTPLSVSFKVHSSNIDTSESLKIAHAVLLKYNATADSNEKE